MLAAAALIASATSVSVAGGQAVAAKRRPNVLIVITDDQPARGTLGVMPQTRRFFSDGAVRYQRAYATTPLCCPSRASIYSGRYAHNHDVKGNMEPEKLDQYSTIQRYLRTAGYRTAYYGKYLSNWDIQQPPPFFQRWAIISKAREGYYAGTWNVGGLIKQVDTYGTTFIRRRAEGFLRESESRDSQPWLMYLAPAAPHKPFRAQRKYEDAPVPPWWVNLAMFEADDRTDKPSYVQERNFSYKEAKAVRKAQLRTLMSVDDMMGRLDTLLAELDEDTDTLVVYLSDNGYLWGQHGLTGKSHAYLPSVRVPMFLRWPARLVNRTLDERLVANIDIAPTVLSAAGVAPDPGYPLDGRSLLASGARSRLLLESWAKSDVAVPTWASTISVDDQYVEYHPPEAEVFREYYDLDDDPLQLLNLLGDGDDSNDPDDVPARSATLRSDMTCEGGSCP